MSHPHRRLDELLPDNWLAARKAALDADVIDIVAQPLP